MANSLGFDVVDSVTKALSDAGYNNQTTKAKEVMIQSEDSAVLVNLKQLETKYKLVYTLPSTIGDASASSLVDVKKFADAVIVDRESIFPESQGFIMKETNLVKDLRSAGLAIYAQVFRNEFVSPPWDFFSDVTVEINSYVQSVNIDGIITDFPKTVRRYKSKCHFLYPIIHKVLLFQLLHVLDMMKMKCSFSWSRLVYINSNGGNKYKRIRKYQLCSSI